MKKNSEADMRDLFRYDRDVELPEQLEEAVSYSSLLLGKPLPRGSEKFHKLLEEIGKLHDQKQDDYGMLGDPFANVRGAQEWGVAPWVGAMIRATDKVRRLQKYALTGKLSNEGARDSFLDLAVYALIALILWEEIGK